MIWEVVFKVVQFQLRQQLQRYSVAPRPDLPPLTGGAIGYFGYDVVRYFERLPDTPPDDRGLPDLAFGLYDELIVFDHVYKTLAIIVTSAPAKSNFKAPCMR